MEGLKHTPGPWALDNENRIIELNGKGIKQIKILSPWKEDVWEGNEEAIANMKLMAAAPEMLIVLKETLNTFYPVLDTVAEQLQEDLLLKIEGLIKKATE